MKERKKEREKETDREREREREREKNWNNLFIFLKPSNTSVHIRVGDTNAFQILSRDPFYLIFLRLVVPPIVVAMIIVPIWRFFYLRKHHALNNLIGMYFCLK